MKFNPGRILCAVTAAALFLTQPCNVVQATEKTAEEIAAEEAAAAEKAAVYDTPADTNSLTGWPEGPNIYALSGCVLDMESGAFIYGKNMNEKLYPASITKLLTVLVALENAELTDTVTFSEDSIAFLEYGDAQIGMKPGEEISMEDALYAILLASANEVSYAVAETVGINNLGGDYSTFIQEMNDRARELGCTSSSWANPNGLHNEDHYTTAHDMALIAAEVYKYEEFRTIMETYEHRIGFTNITEEERVFQQNHKMLWDGNRYSWELATGGKTGYTDQARTTLVTMAEDGNLKLACVVLKDYGGDSYNDTRAMMEYVFENFKKVPIVKEELPKEIESLMDENAYMLLPTGISLQDVECEVTQVGGNEARTGTAVFTYEEQIVGKTDVSLSDAFFEKEEAAAAKEAEPAESSMKEEEKEETTLLQKIFKILAVVIMTAVLLTELIFYRNYRILQARKKRRRKRTMAKPSGPERRKTRR